MKQQFNVNLDPTLIRRVKHHSIDVQLSLSDLVAQVLTSHLERDNAMSSDIDLVLQPMVHVKNMSATVALLEALGGRLAQGSRDGDWVQLAIGGAEIGLLAHPANPDQGEGDVELNFQSHTPLERVEQAARDAGVEIASPTSDEGFGRQLQLRTPDGLLVKINEIDAELIS
ncbi:MAG: VOC family protein [Lapillicoccus sp.]